MKTKSFLRLEEYKHIGKLSIDGAILDIGGSQKSGYHELIGGAHTITTGNIDESYGTDLIFDAEERWPAEDGSYDGVLFVNVLEHLYHYDRALDEAARVLRTGGRVAGVVPFMFNVHGSPYERLFEDRGFVDIKVEELGTGAFSVIYHALLGFVRWYWLAPPLMVFFTSLDKIVFWLFPKNHMTQKYMPLGYYFEATKG